MTLLHSHPTPPFTPSPDFKPGIVLWNLYPCVYTFTGPLLIQIFLITVPRYPLRNSLHYTLSLLPLSRPRMHTIQRSTVPPRHHPGFMCRYSSSHGSDHPLASPPKRYEESGVSLSTLPEHFLVVPPRGMSNWCLSLHPVVGAVQIAKHAVCVVSGKLGANGCRAVVWEVV